MREDMAAEMELRSADIPKMGTARENGREPAGQEHPSPVTQESLRSRMRRLKRGEILEVDFHE